ncbi:MAG: amidohydrolase family protein [Gammaproteobacteria bacterium]|nr:amidohydrolase family protein [Gammaproteobacteria bacterium]
MTKVFDSHFHIIDHRFPLVANQGYLPGEFSCEDYLRRTAGIGLIGGAVVSGSFQAFDQGYLRSALEVLGDRFVGVTQLPYTVTDEEILSLDDAGVRALRFNLRRGGAEDSRHLERMARRVYELVGWHVELYVDSSRLGDLFPLLRRLPLLVIDHLGLSAVGWHDLLRLVEQGVQVKATGFGRVDFSIPGALTQIHGINPGALMFGTDLPSTRAPRPYQDSDLQLLIETLGVAGGEAVLYQNALERYRPRVRPD